LQITFNKKSSRDAENVIEMCLKNVQDMLEKWPRNVIEICLRNNDHVRVIKYIKWTSNENSYRDMLEIWSRCAWNMTEMCLKYDQDVLEKWLKNAWKMTQECLQCDQESAILCNGLCESRVERDRDVNFKWE
jgi:hypothetical protein